MGDMNEDVRTVTLKRWDRSNHVHIDNTFGSPPAITFMVEAAQLIDGVEFSATQKAELKTGFDATTTYPLLNPADDSVLSPDGGSHTMLQLQTYALFKHLAGQ